MVERGSLGEVGHCTAKKRDVRVYRNFNRLHFVATWSEDEAVQATPNKRVRNACSTFGLPVGYMRKHTLRMRETIRSKQGGLFRQREVVPTIQGVRLERAPLKKVLIRSRLSLLCNRTSINNSASASQGSDSLTTFVGTCPGVCPDDPPLGADVGDDVTCARTGAGAAAEGVGTVAGASAPELGAEAGASL